MPRQSKYIPLIAFCLCLGVKVAVAGTPTVAIIGGGQEKGRSHAVLVNADGMLEKLIGSPFQKGEKQLEVLAVGINRSNVGIIGGRGWTDEPYAALFGPEGQITPLTGSALHEEGSGAIYSVAINDAGEGLIGGVQNGNHPYAALFSASGETRPLRGANVPQTGEPGAIYSVAINHLQAGVLGGKRGADVPYVALIAPDGTTTSLQSVRANPTGLISSVAINSSGNGIIGGRCDNETFGALVRNDGETIPLNKDALPSRDGVLYSVAINPSGNGIISIVNEIPNNYCYCALLGSDGTITPLKGNAALQGKGRIASVAINPSGNGIIGGIINSDEAYAALVGSDGTTTPLKGEASPRGSGVISSVGINDSGDGIIGGKIYGQGYYVALVGSDGTTTSLRGRSLPQGDSRIQSVGINASGTGIIGGSQEETDGMGKVYVALVSNDGTTISLKGEDPPEGVGVISSVGINASGSGIIGGSRYNRAYAALVDGHGMTIALNGEEVPRGEGQINSVAINDQGEACIGGRHNGYEVYAGLVRHDGMVTPVTGNGAPQGGGRIHSVAINDSGVALIGGYHRDSELYAAIVAPDGTATSLWNTIFEVGRVSAVGLNRSKPILDGITPESFGEGNAFADPLFALSKGAFKAHISGLSSSQQDSSSLALVADGSGSTWNVKKKGKDVSVWAAPFMFHSNHKGEKDFFPLKSRGGGGLLGVDYSHFGAALAYAYQAAHGVEDGRRAYTHQELAAVYGSWEGSFVFVEGALWGGFSQMRSHRLTLGFIPSKALVKGRLLSPHVKLGIPFGGEGFSIRPFAEFDWANVWQGAVKERGKSGLNLEMNARHLSVIRSEFGCEFAQKKRWGETCMAFKQGISYVNKNSPRAKMVEAHYARAISTFPITLSSKQVHHLCALFLSGTFSSKNKPFPTVSFGYQGEFGSKMTFHALSIELQKGF